MIAGHDRLQSPAAFPVEQLQIPAAMRREPAISPLREHHRQWKQVAALRRQTVLASRGMLRIQATPAQSACDQTVEAMRENVRRNAQRALDRIETLQPEETGGEDEQRPAIADEVGEVYWRLIGITTVCTRCEREPAKIWLRGPPCCASRRCKPVPGIVESYWPAAVSTHQRRLQRMSATLVQQIALISNASRCPRAFPLPGQQRDTV